MRTTHWVAALLLSAAMSVVSMADAKTDAKQGVLRALERCQSDAAALSDAGRPADAAKAYEAAAVSARDALGADTDAGSVLVKALASAATIDDPAVRAGRLNLGVQEAIVALTFKPKMEADLPEGFPAPGPVGEVIVKQYPAYRAARTPMDGQNAAFMTLFRHIESNEIAMSAPVEMGYARAGDKPADLRPRSMAFVYGKPTIGRPGKAGEVDVVDVPAKTVVSIGVRGPYTDDRLADMTRRVDAWLEQHAAEYDRAGEPRYLGYNSPFVPPWSQYGEVQVPVKAKAADNAAPGAEPKARVE